MHNSELRLHQNCAFNDPCFLRMGYTILFGGNFTLYLYVSIYILLFFTLFKYVYVYIYIYIYKYMFMDLCLYVFIYFVYKYAFIYLYSPQNYHQQITQIISHMCSGLPGLFQTSFEHPNRFPGVKSTRVAVTLTLHTFN